MAQTRAKTESNIVEPAKELSNVLLPTGRDMLRFYNFVYLEKKEAYKGMNPSSKEVATEVAERIEEIWARASIPIVSRCRIVQLIQENRNKEQDLNKSYSRDHNTEKYQAKLDAFSAKIDCLFDVATCKCSDFALCRCPSGKRIPEIERGFLVDQRTSRKMVMGRSPVDGKTTSTRKRGLLKKQREDAHAKRMKELNEPEP